jgi:type II secretory pathway component GspD/PulD (secretin)
MPLIKLKSSSITESVNLRGSPTASGQFSELATTQMVNQEVSNLVGSAPELLNTLGELAQSLGTDTNQA